MGDTGFGIASECEEILKSSISGINLGNFFDFICICCQAHRREGSFTQGVVCPKCSAVYDCQLRGQGEITATLRKIHYARPSCKQANCVPTHKVEVGTALICNHCGKKVIVRLSIREVQSEPGTELR